MVCVACRPRCALAGRICLRPADAQAERVSLPLRGPRGAWHDRPATRARACARTNARTHAHTPTHTRTHHHKNTTHTHNSRAFDSVRRKYVHKTASELAALYTAEQAAALRIAYEACSRPPAAELRALGARLGLGWNDVSQYFRKRRGIDLAPGGADAGALGVLSGTLGPSRVHCIGARARSPICRGSNDGSACVRACELCV